MSYGLQVCSDAGAQLDALVTLVVSSVFCENSAAYDETATRLYLPIRAERLHEVCMNDFYLLTHHVRSQKDRLSSALRAVGATVKLLKIRFRPGQPGPAIHVAQIFHVTDFYEGPTRRTAEPAIYVYIRLGCPDSQTAYL